MTTTKEPRLSWKGLSSWIPTVFRERVWIKLPNLVGVVYSEIIKEFFSNASVEEIGRAHV